MTEEIKKDSSKKRPLHSKRQRSVTVYLIILFAMALLLLLLAHFAQQRSSGANGTPKSAVTTEILSVEQARADCGYLL